ncbi:MAG: PHB depolymerase family esterase [Pseudomonadota bacterium]
MAAHSSTWLPAALALALALMSAGLARADTLEHGGTERAFDVYVPDGIATPAPAVVLLHGGGGSGRQLRRHTDFNELADENGFVVIYPDGVDGHWNDGRDDPWLAEQAAARHDDVGFITAILDRLIADGLVDAHRIGVGGISNGGMMTLRLACEAPERFIGFAVVAANIAAGQECPGGEPAPVLFIHGSNDSLVPYDGGPIGLPGGNARGTAWSVPDSLADWAARNRCTGRVLSAHINERPLDGTTVDIVDYTGCKAPLRHILINGGGHTWPGTGARLINLITGRSSREIDGNVAIWAFFDAQP